MKERTQPSEEIASFDHYRHRGWVKFPFDPQLAAWVEATKAAILATRNAPEHAHWHRYGGTWFAGVNVLDNRPDGTVGSGPALGGAAYDFAQKDLGFGALPLDRAQVSICLPGYPQPMTGESKGVFSFRRNRDAAHLDGLLKDGVERRRFLKEYHGYILGIPISTHSKGASPFTIWEGSHRIMGDWLRRDLQALPQTDWDAIDLTDGYQAARKKVFDTCPRITITAKPGEAYVVHRHAIHGMAAWAEGAQADPEGRVIVYFRPPVEDPALWLISEEHRETRRNARG